MRLFKENVGETIFQKKRLELLPLEQENGSNQLIETMKNKEIWIQAGGLQPGKGVLFFQLLDDPVNRLFKSYMD